MAYLRDANKNACKLFLKEFVSLNRKFKHLLKQENTSLFNSDHH